MPNTLLIDLGQNARLSVSGQRPPDYLAGLFSHWARPAQAPAADLYLALDLAARKTAGAFTLMPDDSLQVRGDYKLVPWQAELRPNAASLDIGFCAPLYQEWLAARMIVFPFLQRALLQQEHFLLPASVVCWGEQLLALIGLGGAGKTSLLLACCAAGAQFVGDDFVLASRDGTLQGLGDALSIKVAAFADNAPMRARLTIRQRGWLQICALLERLSQRRVVLSLHVPARQLFGSGPIPRPSPSAAQVVLLEPAEVTAPHKIRIHPEALSRVILLQLKYWEACFGDLIALGRSLRGQSVDYWETYRAQLDDFMRRSQCWRLQVGRQRGWAHQALALLAG